MFVFVSTAYAQFYVLTCPVSKTKYIVSVHVHVASKRNGVRLQCDL